MEKPHWVVKWEREDYHEMDAGVYAYQYSQCYCRVYCSECGKRVGEHEWVGKSTLLSQKAEHKLFGGEMRWNGQVDWLKSIQTNFCPHCGKYMKGEQ